MRIGIIADIHEDTASLDEALAVCERNMCDEIVCLGDIVGFTLPFSRYIDCRDANRCISVIRRNCKTVVAGNHDLYAIRKIPSFTDGFEYRANWYDLDYKFRAKLSKNKIWLYEDSELPTVLTKESAEYLHGLPEYAIGEYGTANIFFSHFNYPDLSGSTIDFPRGTKHLRKHFHFMTENNCLIGVSGHGHPEGMVLSNENSMSFYSFGSYELSRERQWLVGPCVANTTRANGLMIFDTITFAVEIIPLKSPKIII